LNIAYLTHLCQIKVHEAECEELEADGEAVQQPEGERAQRVGCDKVVEVEGEEHGAQGRPQQAQRQERSLVAEALVSVAQHQPELRVDEDEEERVEDGVGHSQAQCDVGGHGRTQGWQRHVHRRRLLLPHRGLHEPALPARGRSGAALPVLAAGLWLRRAAAKETKNKIEKDLSSNAVNVAVKWRERRKARGRKQGELPAAEPQTARERGT